MARQPHIVIDIAALEKTLCGWPNEGAVHDTAHALEPHHQSSRRDQDAADGVAHVSTFVTTLKPSWKTPLGAEFQLSATKSLLQVVDVERGSISEVAGLRKGDILLAAAGEVLRTPRDVIDVIGGSSGTFSIQASCRKSFYITKECEETSIGLTVAAIAPVIVASVEEGGMAERAGLRVGDEILSINGKFCESVIQAVSSLIGRNDCITEVEVRLPRSRSRLRHWLNSSRSRALKSNGKVGRVVAHSPITK
ncbi:hypothetical protein AB1Y20_023198 [Prymnesium parvum]|uniref:PDZ domain-containing protein n=1 Tax=Prymnesium parvum TaxID=97485 RepID=A0AB34JFI1_PRYPA